MGTFTYDHAALNPKVIDPPTQRVNMTYDAQPHPPLPLHEHLVNPTLDPGPDADKPVIVG